MKQALRVLAAAGALLLAPAVADTALGQKSGGILVARTRPHRAGSRERVRI